MHWVQQASWAKQYNFRKIGVVCVLFLKTSNFSSASFVYFLIFCLHYRRKISIFLSDYLVLMGTPAKCLLNIWSKYMQKSKFKTKPADPAPAVYVLYEPHFLLESRFREMSWLSVYLCLWLICKMVFKEPVNWQDMLVYSVNSMNVT